MTPEQDDMVTALLELDEGLNDWEVKFIENMNGLRGTTLSEKQEAKLTQIYDIKVLGKEIDGFQTGFPEDNSNWSDRPEWRSSNEY